MKTLLKKIDLLTDQIEMGFYTYRFATSLLRELRDEVCNNFDVDSDEYNACISALIDGQELANQFK